MTRTRRTTSALLKFLEYTLVLVGVGALLWCAAILGSGELAQWRARQTLASLARASRSENSGSAPSSGLSPSPGSPSPRRSAPIERTVKLGTPLGELSIPRLGLSAVVFHGADAHTLGIGLGHIEHTPFPGEDGNVAIAGHRDTFFRPLRNIQLGDEIVLDTPSDHELYRVSSTQVVNSYEVSVLNPTREPTLTLVTCYPFWFVGHAPDRFVVRATRVDQQPATTDVSTRKTASLAPGSNSASYPGSVLDVPSPAASKEPAQAAQRPVWSSSEGASDEARVRDVIDHFREAYNARLARHPGNGTNRPLTFFSCEVSVERNTATSMCNAGSDVPEERATPGWTFRLTKSGDAWTITSVAMR